MKTMLSMQAVCREGKLSNNDRNYSEGEGVEEVEEHNEEKQKGRDKAMKQSNEEGGRTKE